MTSMVGYPWNATFVGIVAYLIQYFHYRYHLSCQSDDIFR